MTELELFAVMRSIVMSVTGIPECILADQSTIAPPGAYAAIRVMSSAEEGAHGKVRTTYDNNKRTVRTTITTPIQWDVTINFYRCPDPVAVAARLVDCSRLPVVHVVLLKAGLGWLGTDPVVNLTAEQSSMYERRAAIVVHLVGHQVVSDEWNSIESLNGFNVFDEKNRLIHEE